MSQGDTPTPEPVISNQKFEMFSPESGFSPKYVLQSAEEELSPLEKQLRQAEQIRSVVMATVCLWGETVVASVLSA